MEGFERRKQLIHHLEHAKAAIPGGTLAQLLGVSRQVIVQDIALLRAQGMAIEATHKGYIMNPKKSCLRVVEVKHSDEQAEQELHIMVDNGAIVKDVYVNHQVYGIIQTPLNLRSRRDVALFMDKIQSGDSSMLKNVTDGVHFHTLEASSEEILDSVCEELKQAGLLVSEKGIS